METCKLKSNCKITSKAIIDSLGVADDYIEEETGSYINNFDVGNHKITVYIIERYFYRITSTLTVTFVIDQTEEYTTVEIISGGGKISNSWGFWFASWGAEKRALKDAIDSLKQLGFEEV